MVQLSVAFLSLVAAAVNVNAAPLLYKRIAQNIPESTAKWEQACLAAGGGQRCNPISITAFSTLLAAPGPCEQQNAADTMIDLGKELKSQDMITLTQIFAQQPRNTPNSVAVPYCQQAPKNAELTGLFQCQFQGAKQDTFVGGVAVGAPGTIPFGRTTPVSPPGSCFANPSGPIADGTQLVAITQDPKAPGGSGGVGTGSSSDSGATTAAPPAATSKAATPATSAPAVTAAPPASTTAASGDFHLANGEAAQKLNAQFAALTADSACTDGEDACVGTAFAQCVGGQFVTTPCGGGLTCAALPLVNKAGTSITCTTTADAEARIAATGATGGITGSGSGAAASAPAPAATQASGADSDATATPAPAATPAGGFKLANGEDAQALNKKFAALTASSSCTAGENACVGGGFAQCVSGKFVVTGCAGGLTCAALPLVNSKGTSITCTTAADALARIAATGAAGGLTGA